MSEIDPITGRESARTVPELHDNVVQLGRKGTEHNGPSTEQGLPEPPSQQPAKADAALQPPTPPSAPRRPAAEIELKLLVDADRLAGFNDAPVIATNARSKGSRKHLK